MIALNRLIKDIKKYFHSDNYVYYDKKEFKKIIVCNKEEVNIDSKFYWEDLLTIKGRFILKKIGDWYSIDEIFNYFFPALMIYLLENNNNNDEVILYLFDRLEPLYYSQHSKYFYQFMLLTEDQIEIAYQVFSSASESSYHNELKAIIFSLNWIKIKNKFTKNIYIELISNSPNSASPPFLGAEILKEYPFLLQINAQDLSSLCLNDELIKQIDYDIVILPDEIGLYLLPVYLINSLENICNDYSSSYEFALSLVEKFIYKKEINILLNNYLYLLLNIPVMEEQTERKKNIHKLLTSITPIL